MKRFIGLWAIAAVVLAGLALPARGALIFIDDFEDPVVANSSPAPGQPGGGEIGGTGFWSTFADSGVTSSAVVSNGALYLSAQHDTLDRSAGLRSTIHSELNFIDQPLILKVEGFSMNWGATSELIEIGFSSGNASAMHSCSNAISMVIRRDGELLQRLREDGDNIRAWSTISGLDHGPITGFSLYVDHTIYRFEVTYTNGTTGVSSDLTHGLTVANWSNLNLNMTMRTRLAGNTVEASMEKITVIPEPGALSLVLGSLGAALLVRRHRRRRHSA